jgi:ferric-dicitrate binding protein FerR (iron transport regulator)
MTGSEDNQLAERIRQQLDQQADALDELTVARLRAARMRALEKARHPRRRWLPVLGSAVAAALVLAMLVWHQPVELPGTLDDLDIVASGDDLDMIEDLEFYDWLDETQTAG